GRRRLRRTRLRLAYHDSPFAALRVEIQTFVIVPQPEPISKPLPDARRIAINLQACWLVMRLSFIIGEKIAGAKFQRITNRGGCHLLQVSNFAEFAQAGRSGPPVTELKQS